jgi:hypothetical protein
MRSRGPWRGLDERGERIGMTIEIREAGLRSAMVSARMVASLLRRGRRHECDPRDHLVTVVAERRFRDGLNRRYWIRCRLCDFEQGPYVHWQAAWLDAWRAQIAARRRDDAGRPAGDHEPGPV